VQGSYAAPPVQSPCGRFVLARLSRWKHSGRPPEEADHPSLRFIPEFTMCVIDTRDHVVHQSSGRYAHALCWLA